MLCCLNEKTLLAQFTCETHDLKMNGDTPFSKSVVHGQPMLYFKTTIISKTFIL